MKHIYHNYDYDYDEELSFKDFTGQDLSKREMKDIAIFGSCFSNETPNAHVFPDDMTGVTFVRCNLDNCFIPEGNETFECSQRRFKVQNDNNDWIVNDEGQPIEPINAFAFRKRNLPVPKASDIPKEKVEGFIDLLEEAKKK